MDKKIVHWLSSRAHNTEKGRFKTSLAKRSCKDEEGQFRTEEVDLSHLRRSSSELYTRSPAEIIQDARWAANAPRPKIIVIDLAWRLRAQGSGPAPVMPDKVAFLTPECRIINDRRCTYWREPTDNASGRDPNPLLTPYDPKSQDEATAQILHGEALIGAIRMGSHHPYSESFVDQEPEECEAKNEWALWNLAPRADIILLPLREHGKLSPEAFSNSIAIAEKHGFISPEESIVLDTVEMRDFINNCSDDDEFHNISELKRIVISELIDAVFSWFKRSEEVNYEGRTLSTYKLDDLISKYANIHAPSQDNAEYGHGYLKKIIDPILTLIEKLLEVLRLPLEESGIVDTLSELKSANQKGSVGIGDTLVVPMQIDLINKKANYRTHFYDRVLTPRDFVRGGSGVRDQSGGLDIEFNANPPRLELPVIAYKLVEDAVREITCRAKISVVVSAGNSRLNLDNIDLLEIDQILPTKRLAEGADHHEKLFAERDLFHGRAARCGAVIVGSGAVQRAGFWVDPLNRRQDACVDPEHARHVDRVVDRLQQPLCPGDHRNGFANYGACVDAYGRGSTLDVDKIASTKVAKEVYEHWAGASIASIVTACCITNVQHIRMLYDYIQLIVEDNAGHQPVGPYKPFEVRAHLRQWRSLDSWRYDCLEDLMGPPPDIRAWFQGVCMVDELSSFLGSEKWIPHSD